MVFANNALINWYTKKKQTIEISVFGAEFFASKISMKTMRGLRYKLRMMGDPLTGPTHTYGDNMYLTHNTQWP